MKVAAYQAPLLPCGSPHAVDFIRQQVEWCEAHGVSILCCPEAVLGGLADYASRADDIAVDVEGGELDAMLAPLASETVTTIIGFTERCMVTGRLYNAAGVAHRGAVMGVYRKRHPAINRSIYRPGDRTPVFHVGDIVFGILICNDSNYPELARDMASRGATVLFVPTNNALRPERANVVDDARGADAALARENRMAVIRADVTGRADGLVSYGSSEIVGRDGAVLQSARPFCSEVIMADV